MIWIGIALLIGMLIGLITAVEKIKFGEAEDISWAYVSFGMYSWTQVFMLAPVWMLFSLASIFMWQPIAALKAYVLFHAARSISEMIYAATTDEVAFARRIVPKHLAESQSSLKMAYLLLQTSILFVCLLYIFGIFP